MVLTSHTKIVKMNNNVIQHVIYTIVMKLIRKFVYQNNIANHQKNSDQNWIQIINNV